MRISQKHLQICVDNINHYTSHKVSIYFMIGIHLVIDGKEYEHKRKDGTYEGISNKKAYEIMKQYDEEIMAKVKETM